MNQNLLQFFTVYCSAWFSQPKKCYISISRQVWIARQQNVETVWITESRYRVSKQQWTVEPGLPITERPGDVAPSQKSLRTF